MRHKVTRVIDSKGQLGRSLHTVFQFWSAICKRSSALPRRWWRHDMGTSSVILALCAENPLAILDSSLKVPELCSFKVFCGAGPNKPLHQQSSCQWFETSWCSCGVIVLNLTVNLFAEWWTKHSIFDIEMHVVEYVGEPLKLWSTSKIQSAAILRKWRLTFYSSLCLSMAWHRLQEEGLLTLQ